MGNGSGPRRRKEGTEAQMTRKIFLFEILLIAMALVAIVTVYPHFPNRVATHWDINLQPNGYSPKWILFLLGPGMMAGITLFTFVGPWLSPERFQVDSFRSTYAQVMLMLFCAIAYISTVIFWAGAGHRIDEGRAVLGGVCVLFAVMGNVMGKVRRNFFIGIKTPWTIASERVWNATHRLAAKTFVAGGLSGLALTMIGWHHWPIFALLAGALAPTIYSLVLYKRLQRRGNL
jgi:immunity protein, SdpI family